MRTARRLDLVLGAVGLAALIAGVIESLQIGELFFLDLRVYRHAVATWWAGTSPYSAHDYVGGLTFNYPPTALPLLTPFAIGSVTAMGILLVVVGAAALVLVYRWLAPDLGVGALLLIAGMTAQSEPFQATWIYGQVGVLLLVAIVGSVVVVRQEPVAGVLIGAATGLKISPLVVAVIPLVQRRWRALVSMAAALGVLALLATARVPGILGDWASRLGDGLVVVRPIDLHRNESWYGLLQALGGTHFRVVWLAVAVLLLATGVATAVVRTRHHDVIGALAALTLAGVLASTVSWTHHWIWIPVLLVTVQWRGPRTTSQTAHLAAVGALAAAMLLWVPAWFALPDHSLSSTGLTWIASYSYVLFGTFALATLAWTTVERAPHTTQA